MNEKRTTPVGFLTTTAGARYIRKRRTYVEGLIKSKKLKQYRPFDCPDDKPLLKVTELDAVMVPVDAFRIAGRA